MNLIPQQLKSVKKRLKWSPSLVFDFPHSFCTKEKYDNCLLFLTKMYTQGNMHVLCCNYLLNIFAWSQTLLLPLPLVPPLGLI